MQVTYQLTARDYRCGIGAYRRRKVWLRLAYRFGTGIVALVAVLIGATFFTEGARPASYRDLAPLFLLLIVWIFCL